MSEDKNVTVFETSSGAPIRLSGVEEIIFFSLFLDESLFWKLVLIMLGATQLTLIPFNSFDKPLVNICKAAFEDA